MAEKRNKTAGDVLANMSMPILLVALIVFFSIMSRNFLTPLNITNILVQNVHVAIVATAVMIIMISGGCDLSIGYQMSVAAVLVAKMISVYNVSVVLAELCLRSLWALPCAHFSVLSTASWPSS